MPPYPDAPTLPPHYRFTAHTNTASSCHGVNNKGKWKQRRDDGSMVSHVLKRSACWLGTNEPRHSSYRQGRYQQAIDLFVHVRCPPLAHLAHKRTTVGTCVEEECTMKLTVAGGGGMPVCCSWARECS